MKGEKKKGPEGGRGEEEAKTNEPSTRSKGFPLPPTIALLIHPLLPSFGRFSNFATKRRRRPEKKTKVNFLLFRPSPRSPPARLSSFLQQAGGKRKRAVEITTFILPPKKRYLMRLFILVLSLFISRMASKRKSLLNPFSVPSLFSPPLCKESS